MADIALIRAAIASRLQTMLTNTTGGQGVPYFLTNPTPPTLQVIGMAVDYDRTFGRGGDQLIATIQGLSAATTDQAAQEQIDNWCDTTGSTSVKAGIETERPAAVTLGGLVASCRVTGHTRPVITELTNGTQCWSVEFTLEIET